MFSFNSSVHSISIAIFTISLVLPLPSSTGLSDSYNVCASAFFTCGKNISNVGYPFWGGGRPQYCGHPSLQLQCLPGDTGDQVRLTIDQDKYPPYYVVSLKSNHRKISLELQGFQVIPCTFNSTRFSKLFKFTSSDDNITLVYNCPKNISLDNLHASVPCFASPAVNQAYYVHNMSARKEYASCSSLEFPVFNNQLDLYNQGKLGDFSQVLKQGFEVNYEYSSECIKCNNSGGTCGSSFDSDFVCYYKDKISGHVPHKSARIRDIVVPVIVVGAASLAVGIITLCCRKKRRSTKKFSIFWKSKAAKCPNVDAFLQIYGYLALPRHSYGDIKKMTNGFKDKLGEGGYAIVYKGKLLSGSLVAVKVLKQSKETGKTSSTK